MPPDFIIRCVSKFGMLIRIDPLVVNTMLYACRHFRKHQSDDLFWVTLIPGRKLSDKLYAPMKRCLQLSNMSAYTKLIESLKSQIYISELILCGLIVPAEAKYFFQCLIWEWCQWCQGWPKA